MPGQIGSENVHVIASPALHDICMQLVLINYIDQYL